MKLIKLVCHTCKKVSEYKTGLEAFKDGWDVFDNGVAFCGDCPSWPHVVEQAKGKAPEESVVKVGGGTVQDLIMALEKCPRHAWCYTSIADGGNCSEIRITLYKEPVNVSCGGGFADSVCITG